MPNPKVKPDEAPSEAAGRCSYFEFSTEFSAKEQKSANRGGIPISAIPFNAKKAVFDRLLTFEKWTTTKATARRWN